MKTTHFRVIGRVQGVGFRAWTVQTATTLCLRGLVRNVSDGAVEGCLQGAEDAVHRMLSVLHEGPARAHVLSVATEVRDEPPHSEFRFADTRPAPTTDWPRG